MNSIVGKCAQGVGEKVKGIEGKTARLANEAVIYIFISPSRRGLTASVRRPGGSAKRIDSHYARSQRQKYA